MVETFDYKRFLLLNRKRFLRVIIITILAALIGGGLYYIYEKYINNIDVYRCASYYRLEFAEKDLEKLLASHDNFNDYTWNDILDSDKIAGRASEITGIDKDYIADVTTIPTMSDFRFIWVYVDDTDKDKAKNIQNAIYVALSEFAEETSDFTKIEIYDGPYTVVIEKDYVLYRVIITTALIVFVAGLLVLFYKNAADTRIYSYSDVSIAINEMPIGMITEDGVMYPETKAHIKEAFNASKKVAVVLAESFADICDDEVDISVFNRIGLKETKFSFLKHDDEKFYDKLKSYDDFIMLVQYKKCDRTLLNYAYNNAIKMHLKPAAILVSGMDRGFAYLYYGVEVKESKS